MKKLCLIVLGIFLLITTQANAIELEPRAGVAVCHKWGFHVGASTAFPVVNKLYIQPGAFLYALAPERFRNDDWDIGVNVPVYASFRFPVSHVTQVRLNAGPYVGIGNDIQFGPSAEAGVEFKKIYMGVGYFQDCFNDKDYMLNLSIGYKFTL